MKVWTSTPRPLSVGLDHDRQTAIEVTLVIIPDEGDMSHEFLPNYLSVGVSQEVDKCIFYWAAALMPNYTGQFLERQKGYRGGDR